MKMSLRSQKIAGIIQQKIHPLIQKYLSPDQVGIITITQIQVSGDLSYADIYIQSVVGPKNYIEAFDGLSKKISFDLSQVVPTRRPIILRFKQDSAADIFAKLEKKL